MVFVDHTVLYIFVVTILSHNRVTAVCYVMGGQSQGYLYTRGWLSYIAVLTNRMAYLCSQIAVH